MAETTDPRRIRSIAVHADDVISAYEAVTRNATDIVLRVPAPYHGRMRARLHRIGRCQTSVSNEFLDIDPRLLIDADTIPEYPEVEETEAKIRRDPTREYSPAVHLEQHRKIVTEWRTAAKQYIVNQVTIQTPHGTHSIDVKVLEGGSMD